MRRPLNYQPVPQNSGLSTIDGGAGGNPAVGILPGVVSTVVPDSPNKVGAFLYFRLCRLLIMQGHNDIVLHFLFTMFFNFFLFFFKRTVPP